MPSSLDGVVAWTLRGCSVTGLPEALSRDFAAGLPDFLPSRG